MARFCELSGPLDDLLLFWRMRVSEGLSQLFEYRLEVLSLKHDVDPRALLGKSMTVRVNFEDGTTRFFNGYVTRFGQAGVSGRHFVYRMTLSPWVWFLTRTSDCRIFQSMNVPDIVDAVFSDESLKAVDERLSDRGKYEPWEYCVQYRETDFNFVSRLMEQEGIYYFFEHDDGSHRIVLIDSKNTHAAIEGETSISYLPAISSAAHEHDFVSDWEMRQDIQPGVVVNDDYDFKRPGTDLQVTRRPELEQRHARADYEIFDYPGEYDTHSEGDAYAGARIEEFHSAAFHYHGKGTLRSFQPGRRFKLANHHRRDQNAEYLITSVQYELHDAGHEASGGGGSGHSCSFSAISSDQQYRPARTTPRPIVQGIQTAVVTGPSGEEIHTDQYGRIKVQFHWDRLGKSDEKTSCWLRVAFLAAGARWGFVSIPRIGHEVVVSFLEGDPDRPLVTGVVYNGANMPPWELPANKTQWGMLSRSSKGGSAANANAIRFEDKKGEEQVWLHAEKNQDIEVENDETHWVGHDRTKTIDHDETTHVKHDRTETVDNNETITIHGQRTETVDKNETITIHQNRTETVDINEQVTIGVNRTHMVGANDTLTVGVQRTHTVGANETITIGAAQQITIGAAQILTIGAMQATTIGGSSSLSVAADQSVDTGGSHAEQVADGRTTTVGKDDQLTVGKNLVIDAGDSITIKTGSASITMKKDGTIVIKGKDI
ncbi:MAG: type VI secretion system tip protein VgrG, partial [Burkholderiaceae bacterium]|nr:type VI secretion system tip protein VgrG [Burkholderiaceae bacterium]